MDQHFKIAVFCGGPFAFRSITTLIFEKYLAGIVLGSNDSMVTRSFEQQCEQAGIPFIGIGDAAEMGEIENWLDTIQPDAVFSICFPYLIPKTILSRYPIPFINFHTGSLPAYRGPMPIFEVLRKQESGTELTAHFMEEDYDSGAIIYAEQLTIQEEDTFSSLAGKLSERCGIMALNVAQMLEFSTSIPRTHQDEKKARFYPFPAKQELFIDWEKQNATSIIALVKACEGWNNGAISRINGHELHFVKVEKHSDTTLKLAPGTVLDVYEDGSYDIACIDGQVIHVVQSGNENGIYSPEFIWEIGIHKETIFY